MPKKKRAGGWDDTLGKDPNEETDSTSEEKEESDLSSGDLDEEADESEEKNY